MPPSPSPEGEEGREKEEKGWSMEKGDEPLKAQIVEQPLKTNVSSVKVHPNCRQYLCLFLKLSWKRNRKLKHYV